MIVAVTPNPAWDVTYQVPQLNRGMRHRIEIHAGRAGGKGLNVARVARILGAHCHAVAPLGGPLGTLVLEDFEEPATWVPIAGRTRQGVAVVDDEQATLFVEAGPTVTPTEWQSLVDAVSGLLSGARESPDGTPDVLAICGSLPYGVDPGKYRALIGTGVAAKVPVIVDVSGPPLLWAAGAGVDLLTPNEGELLAATGAPDVESGAQRLLDAGAGAVLVFLGPRGMELHTPIATIRARIFRQLIGNATGAGDAAVAALALTADRPWEERLRLAVAVASASVLEPTAGAVDPERVTALSRSVLIEG